MSPLSTPARMHLDPARAGRAALLAGVAIGSIAIAITITTTTTTPSGWVSVRD
jgi:hypothetical protein